MRIRVRFGFGFGKEVIEGEETYHYQALDRDVISELSFPSYCHQSHFHSHYSYSSHTHWSDDIAAAPVVFGRSDSRSHFRKRVNVFLRSTDNSRQVATTAAFHQNADDPGLLISVAVVVTNDVVLEVLVRKSKGSGSYYKGSDTYISATIYFLSHSDIGLNLSSFRAKTCMGGSEGEIRQSSKEMTDHLLTTPSDLILTLQTVTKEPFLPERRTIGEGQRRGR